MMAKSNFTQPCFPRYQKKRKKRRRRSINVVRFTTAAATNTHTHTYHKETERDRGLLILGGRNHGRFAERGNHPQEKSPNPLCCASFPSITPSFCVLESFVHRRKTILTRIMVISALKSE
jgi:hypothetical protein